MSTHKLLPGYSHSLGATDDGEGTNFALYSATAQRVELCLFDSASQQQTASYDLLPTDNVWHGYLQDVKAGDYYGYRVHGNYDPAAGLWFNPHKLLIDPYARKLSSGVILNDLHYAYANPQDPFDGQMDRRDNARVMPKCIVTQHPQHSISTGFSGFDDGYKLIYETHVKGFTRQHPQVEQALQGTYPGICSEAIINHLKQLSVTAIELLPVHSFMSEQHLQNKGLSNYWGYNSVNFFCPHLDYAFNHDDAAAEFQEMISQLHAHDLKIIIDVVYNHTAEGDHRGPMLSFKGIDNKTYYRLDENNRFINHSGCGNTLNLANQAVIELITSSLRYWTQCMGIDGFRFDLASVLGRDEHDRFNSDCRFFSALIQDPVLKNVKLIAEPWDIGPGGYQTGQFTAPWAQWNDIYRDTVREFWRNDQASLADIAESIMGSSQKFEHGTLGRRSWASVNFITAHDGFTLTDLVSYENKHNRANAEDNNDGHNHNLSFNHGVEGDTDNQEIIFARDQTRRNLIATVLLSQGTPMIYGGDEFGNSQFGNNNAYCQDNPTSWLNWDGVSTQKNFLKFCQVVAQIRRHNTLLHGGIYIHKDNDNEQDNKPYASWLKMNGDLMTDADWHNPAYNSMALLLCINDIPFTGFIGAEKIILIINHGKQSEKFNLINLLSTCKWEKLIDTSLRDTSDMRTILTSDIEIKANSLIIAAAL